MTLDEFVDKLRPLALELADTPDKSLPPELLLFKAQICLMMGWCEMDPKRRFEKFPHLLYTQIEMLPLFQALIE